METLGIFLVLILCMTLWSFCMGVVGDFFGIPYDSFMAFIGAIPLVALIMFVLLTILSPIAKKLDQKEKERRKRKGLPDHYGD